MLPGVVVISCFSREGGKVSLASAQARQSTYIVTLDEVGLLAGAALAGRVEILLTNLVASLLLIAIDHRVHCVDVAHFRGDGRVVPRMLGKRVPALKFLVPSRLGVVHAAGARGLRNPPRVGHCEFPTSLGMRLLVDGRLVANFALDNFDLLRGHSVLLLVVILTAQGPGGK